MSTTVTVFPTSDTGYLESKNATFATALAGSNLSVNTYGTDEIVIGQDFASAQYWIYEGFMAFDTSAIPDNATIDTVVVRLSGLSPDNDDTPFTYNLYSGYSFGTLATADWRTPAQLGGLTLRASVASSAWTTGTFDMTDTSMAAAINKTGLTELVIASSRTASSTTPTQQEWTNLDADATYPQLIITYHIPFGIDATSVFDQYWDSIHDFGSPQTKSHAGGTPTSVSVGNTWGGTSIGNITSITYGGVPLTLVSGSRGADTASEPGQAEWWFLGSGVPTGTQDCVITFSGDPATLKRSVIITTTGEFDVQVSASANTGENIANSSLTLDSGSDVAYRFLALYYGGLASAVTVGSGMTSIMAVDGVGSGSLSFHAAYQTTPASGSTARGFTHVSDDVALAGIAISETTTPSVASGTGDSFGALGFFG